MAKEPTTAFGKYIERGFVLLLTMLAGSIFLFWFTKPHDVDPFLRVVEFGIPAWFGLNAVERWAVDRPKAIAANGAPKT